jgi:hypothetical protein
MNFQMKQNDADDKAIREILFITELILKKHLILYFTNSAL